MRGLLVLLLIGLSLSGWTWGARGHREVARIAEAHLSNAARQEIDRLLVSDLDANGLPSSRHDLAQIATWADEIKRHAYGRQRAAWHYEDLPVCTSAAPPCPRGRCLEAALHRQLVLLADRQQSDARREVALKWVVHLVADLHQPLHVSDDDDAGGNRLKVRLRPGGRVRSLHHVWDTTLVRQVLRDPPTLSAQEIGTIDDDIPAWIAQSHALAVDVAYGALPGFHCASAPEQDLLLDAHYQSLARHSVALQLQRAGLRLAHLLNDTLAPVGTHP